MKYFSLKSSHLRKKPKIKLFLVLVFVLISCFAVKALSREDGFSGRSLVRYELVMNYVNIDDYFVNDEEEVFENSKEFDKDYDYDWYVKNECGTNTDLDVLSRILFAEGGNQSEECIEKIAQVVLNRVEHSSYPDSLYEVVYEVNNYNGKVVYQFAPVASGSINNKSSEKCYNIAKRILNDYELGNYDYDNSLIAFESFGPEYNPHSTWSEYEFSIDDMAFYSVR